ncbi:hypothetical protein DENSPDRAFT_550061 [Dentipellis sp. KUC8613]|nr:hypothetical protein DENSPDRAFT_550061 [Dentipellis sp. KUC8613]
MGGREKEHESGWGERPQHAKGRRAKEVREGAQRAKGARERAARKVLESGRRGRVAREATRGRDTREGERTGACDRGRASEVREGVFTRVDGMQERAGRERGRTEGEQARGRTREKLRW